MNGMRETPLLSTSEVADLLEVHPSTVKRWFGGGGSATHATRGGHRRIPLEHALEEGATRGQLTFLSDFAGDEARVWNAFNLMTTEGRFEATSELFFSWLVGRKSERIGRLLFHLLRSKRPGFATLADQLIRPWLESVGKAWAIGQCRVGQERLASGEVAEALIAYVRESEAASCGTSPNGSFDSVPTSVAGRKAVVGAMEDDQHLIGSLVIRAFLVERGWEVEYLGPDVPIEEFGVAQLESSAELVCVSFATPLGPADVERMIGVASMQYDPASPYAIAVGGSGVSSSFEPDWTDLPFVEARVFDGLAGFSKWEYVHDSTEPRTAA